MHTEIESMMNRQDNMNDDNKDISSSLLSSSSSTTAVDDKMMITSLLPKDVHDILEAGMRNGFKNPKNGEHGYLYLGIKNINDSMMPEICEWIAKLDDKVKILDLRINQITSIGASVLFDTLRTLNSSTQMIRLNDNLNIDDKCMKSLGEYVKSNKSIEVMLLSENKISDVGIEILTPYIDGNTTFKGLHLNGNKEVTDKSIPLLVKMIESSYVEDIDVENTSITQKNEFICSLACNTLKRGSDKLYALQKNLNDNNMMKICDLIKRYRIGKLREICLFNNKITSKGASILVETLRECNLFVLYLNLSSNQIDDECMGRLGEFVQENECLEELRLSKNIITDKGVKILTAYLIGNTRLERLDLCENQEVTDISVPTIVEMIKRTCITIIDLWHVSMSEEYIEQIKHELSIPIDEREIPIKSNTKSAAKISKISTPT